MNLFPVYFKQLAVPATSYRLRIHFEVIFCSHVSDAVAYDLLYMKMIFFLNLFNVLIVILLFGPEIQQMRDIQKAVQSFLIYKWHYL